MALPTSRRVYALTKYSKAYQTQQHNAQANAFEWQHHTQPLLQLVLTTAQTPSGHSQAIRLIIVWSPSSAPVGGYGRKEQVFEDLDLIYFQGLANQRKFQSSPLKAVYRGHMVGFKYLLPSNVATPSMEYCRFQVNFQSAEVASQFIEAIASVCPCKSGGMNDQARPFKLNQSCYAPDQAIGTNEYPSSSQSSQALQTPMRTTGRQMTIPVTPIQQFPNAYNLTTDFRSPLTPASLPTHMTPESSYFGPTASTVSQESFSNTQSQISINDHNSDRAHLSTPLSSQSLIVNTASATTDSCPIAKGQRQSAQSKSNSLRVLTPPSSSSDVADPSTDKADHLSTAHNLNIEENQNQPHASDDALIALLKETADLDGMPQDELENLVAIIIREEGFARLLDKMDTLWKLRGFLDI